MSAIGLDSAAAGGRAAADEGLGWLGILRLGLVQTALGSIIVLTTSTLNRVMVVELALPAMLPGALVGLHHAVQLLRPRLGHGSDVGGSRTAWIVGGMALLALGGIGAAIATAWMATAPLAGTLLAVAAFIAIGIGVGAAGTSLLVLLAKQVAPSRRAAAATCVWMMMIAGFIVTAAVAGRFLDPFTPDKLVVVVASVAACALLLTLFAVRGIERHGRHMVARREAGASGALPAAASLDFRAALAQVWHEPEARRFTVFVFVSMLAYSAQDLILEPFAGTVFGYTPGESTQLAGVQNGGVLAGMLLVALASVAFGGRFASLRAWNVGGCIASALALAGLAAGGVAPAEWPLRANVFLLGLANGAFAVAAIGSMMSLAGGRSAGREGVRMGLWGAAQAIAFGVGGFAGTLASDTAHWLLGSASTAYASVFAAEGLLFVVSAVMAARIATPRAARVRFSAPVADAAADALAIDAGRVRPAAGGGQT